MDIINSLIKKKDGKPSWKKILVSVAVVVSAGFGAPELATVLAKSFIV